LVLLKALAKEKIPADNVEGVCLRPDQTAAVFNAGQVDTGAVWATYAVAEIGSGKAHFLADGEAIGSDNYSLNAARTGFAEQHPAVVKALLHLHPLRQPVPGGGLPRRRDGPPGPGGVRR